MRALLVMLLVVAGDVLVAPGGVLPARTQLVARMNTNIGTTPALGLGRFADETRTGAPFVATIDARVVDDRGATRLPAGAVVHGHVARLERGHGEGRAVIELAPDRIDAQPLRARVVDVEVQQLAGLDGTRDAEVTAFWGALMGGVAFGVPGVAIGYGFGGTSGAVTAAGARQVDGWISAGSNITIELEAPLRVGRCPTC